MRLYCKGMASDDRRQGGSIYQTKFLSSSSQIYLKENAAQQRPVKNRLLRNYTVRNEGFFNALLWWTKGVTYYTCDINDSHKFTREQAEKLVKTSIQLTSLMYIDGLESQK
jgi:hypothetical protein